MNEPMRACIFFGENQITIISCIYVRVVNSIEGKGKGFALSKLYFAIIS